MSKQIEYYAANAAGTGADLVLEGYFAEALLSEKGHGVIATSTRVVAIAGTRYLDRPIRLTRSEDVVAVVNGSGETIMTIGDVVWATGDWASEGFNVW